MKPEFEKIQNRPLHSFMTKTVSRPRRPSLKEAWHFHPEIEICHTIKSSGRRFVGNNIADYQQGDLVLFGSNLPHGFITEQPSEQIVIQFLDDFLGKDLFSKPETGAIQELLERSKKGICFGSQAKASASSMIIKVLETEGLPKILALLELLDYLAHTDDYTYITEDSFRPNTKMSELERVQIIFDYILQNYQEQVHLETAAQLINMTKSSFCKFLKKHAKKTFSQIVNEIRIGHACELFMQTDKNISTVAFESGFNDVSYFSRTFKKIIHDTPRRYMERHR